MVGPKFLGTASLGEHIARLVLGKKGAGSGLEATAILPVTSRLASKVGILPAKIDRIAALQRITGGLTTSLIKTNDRVSRLINGGARGGKTVELIRYLVVGLGARWFDRLGIRDGALVGGACIKEPRNLGGGFVGALDAGKQAVPVRDYVLGIKLGGTAGLGVDITRFVLGKQRAGSGLEITAILAVAGRFPVKVGILPAEVDCITTLEGVTGSLAASLVKTNNWVGCLVDGSTGRSKTIALVGDLVVLIDTDGLLFIGFLVEIRAIHGNIVGSLDLGYCRWRFGLDGALHSSEETVGVG